VFSLEGYLPDALLPAYTGVRDTVVSVLSTLGFHTPKPTGPSSETTAARDTHNQAETMLRTTETSLKADEDALKRMFALDGFGRRGEWRKLDGLCLEKDTGE
jgi:protein kinase C substrate 80K-H